MSHPSVGFSILVHHATMNFDKDPVFQYGIIMSIYNRYHYNSDIITKCVILRCTLRMNLPNLSKVFLPL